MADSSGVVRVVIPGVPVPQPRHRVGAAKFVGKGKVQAKAGAYIPKDHPIHAYKEHIAVCARLRLTALRQAHGANWSWDTAGPMEVDLLFVLPRPQRLIYRRRGMPRLWHQSKPDKDNLQKAVYDAVKGLLWEDDSQVCDGRTTKVFASGSEEPYTILRVTRKLDLGPGLEISI